MKLFEHKRHHLSKDRYDNWKIALLQFVWAVIQLELYVSQIFIANFTLMCWKCAS